MRKITRGQIRAIWAKARILDLSEDELRDIVNDITGSRRISTMEYSEAAKVLDKLESWIEILESRHGRATRKQVWKIRMWGREIFGGEKKLRRWIEKKWRVSSPVWLSREDASKVIDALKSMRKRGYKVGNS